MPDVQRGRRPRIAVSIGVVAVAVLLLVLAFSDPILNGWVIPGLVGSGLRKQGITLEPGHVHWSLSANLFHFDSLRVRLPLPGRNGSLVASASAVTLRGPDLLALLFGGGFSLKSLEVGSLRLAAAPPDTLTPPEPAEPSQKGSSYGPVSIGRLEISSGTLGGHLPLGDIRIDTVASLSLTAAGLSFGAGPLTAESITALLGSADLKLSEMRVEFSSSGYALSTGRLIINDREGLRATDLAYHPADSDSAFFDGSPYKRTRFAASCENFAVPRWQWHNGSSTLSVPSVHLDSLRVDMLANRRKPTDPDTTPLLMPNQMIARLPFGLSIDTLAVRHGRLKYAEQFVYDLRPAALEWTHFTVHATGIANRPADAPPAAVEARGIFMGGAPMTLRMALPCTDTLFSMSYAGSLGAMLMPLINPWVTISDRVRLTSGWCDSVSYGVNVRRGRAEGFVTPLYSGLRIQMLEQKSGDPGLGTEVKSFLANAFKIRPMNPEADQPPRVGHVRNDHAPSAPFFGFLWKSLRGGLGDVVGF